MLYYFQFDIITKLVWKCFQKIMSRTTVNENSNFSGWLARDASMPRDGWWQDQQRRQKTERLIHLNNTYEYMDE